MRSVIPNNNAALEIVSAFQIEGGELMYEHQPVLAFALDDDRVAEVIGLEAPTANEVRAVIDTRSGNWWMLGDVSGSGIDRCKAALAELFGCAATAPTLRAIA